MLADRGHATAAVSDVVLAAGATTVATAGSAEEVHTLVQGFQRAVVLVDVDFWGLHGVRELAKVARLGATTPVLFLSNGASVEAEEALWRAPEINLLRIRQPWTPRKRVNSAQAGTPTVLVVDDADPVRRLLVTLLEREGYRPSSVASGEAALQVIQETTPDLMILDINMPGLNGVQVLERMQGALRDGACPAVIVVSASRDPSVRKAAWSSGRPLPS